MLAVVQIGSKTWRSPCSTVRSVPAAVGGDCALSRPGADTITVVAALPLRNERRDAAIGSTPSQPVSDGARQNVHDRRKTIGFRHGSWGAARAKHKASRRAPNLTVVTQFQFSAQRASAPSQHLLQHLPNGRSKRPPFAGACVWITFRRTTVRFFAC